MAASRTASSADKMNDYILFKNIDGKYLTLKDCIEENKKARQQKTETEETEETTEAEENKEDARRKNLKRLLSSM